MKKIPISFLICLFTCNIVQVIGAVELECYQCNPLTQECDDTNADVVKCGHISMSRCVREIKKDSADKSLAIRKCEIVDSAGHVSCPSQYECFFCNENLCNANPLESTTEKSEANFSAAFPTVAFMFAIFTMMYL